MVFLVYYPRMKGVRTCLSGLTPQTVMKLTNVSQVESIDENDMNPVIVLPREYADERLSNYVLESNWSLAGLPESELTYLIRYAPQKSQCFWRKIEGIEGMEEITQLTGYPDIEKPYRKARPKCQRLPVKEPHVETNASSPSRLDTSPVLTICLLLSFTLVSVSFPLL